MINWFSRCSIPSKIIIYTRTSKKKEWERTDKGFVAEKEKNGPLLVNVCENDDEILWNEPEN